MNYRIYYYHDQQKFGVRRGHVSWGAGDFRRCTSRADLTGSGSSADKVCAQFLSVGGVGDTSFVFTAIARVIIGKNRRPGGSCHH